MGLLTTLMGALTGKTGTGDPKVLLMQAIISLVTAKSGSGLTDLLQQFQTAGLGPIIQSWLNPGPNLPITPQQVESGMGSERLTELSKNAGLSLPETARELSGMLPELIAKLAPRGHGAADKATIVTESIDNVLDNVLRGK